MNEEIPNSNAIINTPPVSPYDHLLTVIYNTTPGSSIEGKLDQMFNVALVVLNIRTGAIIDTKEMDYVIDLMKKYGLLAKKLLYSKESSRRYSQPILIANPRNETIAYYFQQLPTEPPDLKNRANNEKRNKQDTDIGHILGYLDPIPIWQYLGKPAGNIHVSVTIRDARGNRYTIMVFPQRFRVMTEEMRTALNDMVKKIRTVPLPLGFQVESAKEVITPPPEPVQGGSRRRRVQKLHRKRVRNTRKHRR